MLRELRVRGMGVIEDVTVTFGPGLTALTGETGAGKTLLVEALHLVLGGRAVPGLVRADASEALVEARFEGCEDMFAQLEGTAGDTGTAEVVGAAEADGAGPGGSAHGSSVHTASEGSGEIVLTRSVSRGGRGRAWINGRMVPLARLAEVGVSLVDIYGQRDHQSLLAPAAQRQALDEHAGADPAPLEVARRRLREIERELETVGGDEAQRSREVELLRYQIAEVDSARLDDPDEEEQLIAEEERLADMAALRQAAADALSCLDRSLTSVTADPAPAAVDLLGKAAAALGGRTMFEIWEQRLRSVMAELGDVASDLHEVVDTWQEDPARLEEVQDRRRLLAGLRKKYGPTLADVKSSADRAREKLEELEGLAERSSDLERRRKDVHRQVMAAAGELGAARRAGAPVLAAALTRRLGELAMSGARLEVAVGGDGGDPDDKAAAGDDVEILLGANPGEPMQPLARVASGGELARTMLALRLVAAGGPPTVIFDEVDTGVGGSAALALGRALTAASSQRQVLVVTHLPQVAACADRQVRLDKHVEGGRTVATAVELDPPGRVVELSRMLSGSPDSATARAHAQELLATARGVEASTTAVPRGG